MQLRREKKEEHAMEVQVIIYETIQQAKSKEQGRQEEEEDHET
jgi:hypothetical protein